MTQDDFTALCAGVAAGKITVLPPDVLLAILCAHREVLVTREADVAVVDEKEAPKVVYSGPVKSAEFQGRGTFERALEGDDPTAELEKLMRDVGAPPEAFKELLDGVSELHLEG